MLIIGCINPSVCTSDILSTQLRLYYATGEFYFRRSTSQDDLDAAAVYWSYLGESGSYNPTLVYVLTWYKVTNFRGQNQGYPVSQAITSSDCNDSRLSFMIGFRFPSLQDNS